MSQERNMFGYPFEDNHVVLPNTVRFWKNNFKAYKKRTAKLLFAQVINNFFHIIQISKNRVIQEAFQSFTRFPFYYFAVHSLKHRIYRCARPTQL
jgi:hypothetical protein